MSLHCCLPVHDLPPRTRMRAALRRAAPGGKTKHRRMRLPAAGRAADWKERFFPLHSMRYAPGAGSRLARRRHAPAAIFRRHSLDPRQSAVPTTDYGAQERALILFALSRCPHVPSSVVLVHTTIRRADLPGVPLYNIGHRPLGWWLRGAMLDVARRSSPTFLYIGSARLSRAWS